METANTARRPAAAINEAMMDYRRIIQRRIQQNASRMVYTTIYFPASFGRSDVADRRTEPFSTKYVPIYGTYIFHITYHIMLHT